MPSSVIKGTKAGRLGHIKWIEDLVPNIIWSEVPVNYDKHALWGISHWGCKRQQFYGFAANKESARNVYSKRRIIAVTKLQIIKWLATNIWLDHVRRDDDSYIHSRKEFKIASLQRYQRHCDSLHIPIPEAFIYRPKTRRQVDALMTSTVSWPSTRCVLTVLMMSEKALRLDYLPRHMETE
ncbi:hypothetical protein Tco_0779119 [Tanacetum coccineum]